MARPSPLALVATVLLSVTPGMARAGEIVMREALVLPAVGKGGRRPFHTDALLAAIADGSWTAPNAGDTVTDPEGVEHTWAAAAVGDDGWFRGDELRGGYLYWSVNEPAPRVAMLHASGQSSVRVGDAWRPGDPYANGWVQVPVQLHAGRNDLLFHSSRGRVRATLVEPKSAVFFQLHDRTMPDLIHGEDWAVQGGILIANASPRAVAGLVVRAGGSGLPLHETRAPVLAPLTVRKIPFWFGGAVAPDVKRTTVRLELADAADGSVRVIDTAEFAVRVRKPGQTHKRTFISAIDGSVQYYAVTPMAKRDEGEGARPALFLTLHGAGVEGLGQAAVYRRKDWGYVVAPTNRRPFGFDWEDWGRLDAIEVLELNQSRLGIDPDRTYLTGHSMGGHGTWQVGVTYPDRFAAIGPSAGWRSFWAYTGTERFEGLTPVERVLRLATNPSDTVALARNTLHYGVYILHGDKDDNVPVEQARFMHEHLGAFHDDVAYHEEPGAGHWWGNRCCDWDPMFEFFRARSRPAHRAHVEFHTANPGISASSGWVAIEQQLEPLDFSSVGADIDPAGRRLTVTTKNVARLAIDLAEAVTGTDAVPDPPADDSFTVDIDGTILTGVGVTKKREIVSFTRTRADAPWTKAEGELPEGQKGPHRYGPFKDGFRHHVMFVYGTLGTDAENAWAAAKARFDAETFWYRGNASVDVVRDGDFDPEAEPDRSVILYGNAATNGAWSALLESSPVVVDRDGITIDGRRLAGADLATLFIRPRPGSPIASVGVVAGTGVAGARLTDRLPYFVSGVGYPDCVVLGPEVLREGVAGVRVAGIFGLDWSVGSGSFAWRDGQDGE